VNTGCQKFSWGQGNRPLWLWLWTDRATDLGMADCFTLGGYPWRVLYVIPDKRHSMNVFPEKNNAKALT